MYTWIFIHTWDAISCRSLSRNQSLIIGLIHGKRLPKISILHVLQHTATHCSTLQNTAKHCNNLHVDVKISILQVLQHTATRCNTLQHAAKIRILHVFATLYSHTLQYTATHCNTLHHIATNWNDRFSTHLRHTVFVHAARRWNTLQHNTLQHAATHCKDRYPTRLCHCTFLHTATRCTTRQHSATHFNTLQLTATLCTNVHSCCAFKWYYW